MDIITNWLYKLFWIFVFLAVVIPLGTYVLRQVYTPKKIQVIVEEKKGEEGKGGESLVFRWQALLKPVSLQNFYEITTPNLPDVFGIKNKDVLEEFKLTIKGVEIKPILNAVRGWLNPPDYQVYVKTVADEGQKKHLEMRLECGNQTLRTWYRSTEELAEDDKMKVTREPKTQAEGQDKTKGDDKTKLEDFALFQLLHFLYYDAEAPKIFRKSLQSSPRFPNPQAMATYYGGMRQLDAYLQSHQQSELEGAINQFRTMWAEMPHFADGLMLLGLALTENREEEEAAKIFKLAANGYASALENLKKKTPPPEAAILDAELDRCQVRLWRATALRKLYGWPTNHDAVKELIELITDVKEKSRKTLQPAWDQFVTEAAQQRKPPPLPDKVRAYLTYTRLLAQAQCELADTIGSYVIYAKPYTPEELKKMFSKEALKSLVGTMPDVDKIESQAKTDPDECIKTIKALHEKELRKAEEYRNELQGYRSWCPQGEMERAEMQRAELDSQIYRLTGYVQYRLAAWTCKNDNNYRKACAEALTNLEKADATRPNHYVNLQHLGIVLLDPIYDPEGNKLGMARKYFEQSLRLKQKDYYGHEQLARVVTREVELHRASKAEKIDEGIKYAETAIALRPWAGGAYVSLAELKTMKYLLETNVDERRKLATDIIHALEQARRLWPNSPRDCWVQLNWEVAQFKTQTNGGNFQAQKKKMQCTTIPAIEQQFPPVETPEVKFFRENFKELKQKVTDLTPEALPNLQIYF